MNQVTEEHVFDTFNTQMRASLTAALKWGDGKLYTSDVQDLDQVYLSGFAKAADRQYPPAKRDLAGHRYNSLHGKLQTCGDD